MRKLTLIIIVFLLMGIAMALSATDVTNLVLKQNNYLL